MTEALERLIQYIQKYESAAVAFSGGVDSAVLSYAAMQALGERAAAFTAASEFMPKRIHNQAHLTAQRMGIRHEPIFIQVLANADIARNDERRCYHCKKAIFTALKTAAAEKGFSTLFDGTNADDNEALRPGMAALRELGVLSPLRELSIGKKEIREIAREAKLYNRDAGPYSCLATKVRAGKPITPGALATAEQVENVLYVAGITGFKVRLQEQGVKIELSAEQPEELLDAARGHLQRIGISPVEYIKTT